MKTNGKIEITDAILIAHINEELDLETSDFVKNWIEISDKNKSRFEKLLNTWEVTGNIDPKPVFVNTNLAWDTVLNKINNTKEKVIPIDNTANRKIYFSIAAMIIILVGVFSILQLSTTEISTITQSAKNEVLIDSLSDGSIVTLNKNSSLIYQEKFSDNERRVALNGEAYFAIERNEEKPFIIDLNPTTYVKVLGTSFNIKSYDKDTLIEVFVNSGKVVLGNEKDKITLVAGEKGVLNKRTNNLYKETDDKVGLKEMYWLDPTLIFDHITLKKSISILNVIFDDTIILDCNSYEDSLVFSEHYDDSLIDILMVIVAMHQLSVVEKQDDGKKIFRINCDEK